MTPGQAPPNMSERTLAEQIAWLAAIPLEWPRKVFGTKIEPIEDEV